MDSDPPQRSSSSSELFICFSSRLSSSMKHNAAIKKTSPMFSTTANKNPEPSSPKVTCIGQVRVKAKKQRQRRHSTGAQVEHHSVCVAFRSIRAEFSCLIPCKSSCFSSEQSSYEAAADEEDKPGEIQFVDVDDDDDEDDDEVLPVRRHVFDNLEIEDLIPKTNREEGRISICVPPRNALLLMRCRSDPLKMADLTSRVHDVDEEEEECEYVDEFEVIDEKRDPDESILETEDKLVMEILINEEEAVEEDQLIDSELKGGKSETDHDDAIAEENEIEEAISEKQELSRLPDCLLLMMCEPKLSMEVSKETWVCSRDFIRRPPEKKVKKINGQDEAKKKIVSTDNPEEIKAQSAVGDVSMATETLEEKLVNAVGCEPFVLTRCNSVPISNDSCSWKNRNLEPHRHSCVGLRTAEVGF